MKNYNDYIVYLKPKGFIKDFPHSDTLFGALMWAIRFIYGENELNKVINAFINGEKIFCASSSFPVYKKQVFTFPVCAGVIKLFMGVLQGKDEKWKEFKKAKYWSVSFWRKFIENGEKTLKEFKTEENLNEDKGIVSLGEIKDRLMTTGIVIRNEINRLKHSTEEGKLFFKRYIMLNRNFELYFILRTLYDKGYFEPLLKYLADTGIGGEKSAGYNQFATEIIDVPSEIKGLLNRKGEYFVCLSRYIPDDGEIQFPPESFEIESIIYAPETKFEFAPFGKHKKLIKFIKEGSKVKILKEKEIYGKICEINFVKEDKNYRVIRSGLCLPLFIQ